MQLTLAGSLQLSFQPMTASAKPIATEPGSKALTVKHQGCAAPSMGAFLSGELIPCRIVHEQKLVASLRLSPIQAFVAAN